MGEGWDVYIGVNVREIWVGLGWIGLDWVGLDIDNTINERYGG